MSLMYAEPPSVTDLQPSALVQDVRAPIEKVRRVDEALWTRSMKADRSTGSADSIFKAVCMHYLF
jgi:hypothetical protein